MKYNKILKENEYNKNSFLITCVCSIVLLLTLCYFGINTGTYGYLNSNGLTQLDFIDYSCSNSADELGSYVKTYLDGSSMVEDIRYDNHCIRSVATSTCYVTAKDSGSVLTETCSQYNYDYYCTKTGSEVVYQRYKKCTRGTSVDYCDVQSNTGCGSLESQGYTCNWAESDVYSCTNYLDNGAADETTKTCVYGYLMSSDETDTATISKIQAYASDGSNCPCPGSSWNVAGANSCTQKITSSTSGYSYKKSGMDYCSSSFTSDGDSCVLENSESTGDTSTDNTKKVNVTLDANGGKFSDGATTYIKENVIVGEAYSFLKDPADRSNYEFLGWYTTASGGTKVTGSTEVENDSDHTLYAHWNYIGSSSDGSTTTDTVTCEAGQYYKGQGTCDTCPAGYYCPGGTFKSSDSSRDGIIQCPSGTTSTAESDSASDCKSTSSGGTTTKKTFTAKFDANGGKLDNAGALDDNNSLSCTGTSSCIIEKGLPSATKECYVFKGWGTSSSCTSGNLNSVTVSGNPTKFYACWVKDSSCDNNSDTNPESGSNNTPGTDEDGNVTENQPTGELTTIALIWFFGLFAIAYAFYYFKSVKEN